MKNTKGVAPIMSSILMMSIAVGAMLVAISASQNIIITRSLQMGERVCVENVFFTDTRITIYLFNAGDVGLTLEYAVINGKKYPFVEGIMPLPVQSSQYVTIDAYSMDPQGTYRISFVSTRNSDLGVLEVQYP